MFVVWRDRVVPFFMKFYVTSRRGHPSAERLSDGAYPLLVASATASIRPTLPQERPHRDKMMISSESPDAIEEMLWMAFFPNCHNPTASTIILDATVRNPAFEICTEPSAKTAAGRGAPAMSPKPIITWPARPTYFVFPRTPSSLSRSASRRPHCIS